MKTADTDVMAEAQKMVNESKEQFKENLSDVSFVNTPETEWEKEKEEFNKMWNEGKFHWNENKNTEINPQRIWNVFIQPMLIARDTYWKERVRSKREALAELEHDQWIAWSKNIAETEQITPARLERWKKLWRPYAELTEAEKDQDREWADQALDTLLDNLK